MNTLLPNLNATPVAPASRGFQADPQPSDASQSFSSTLKEATSRAPAPDNSQVKSGQNAPVSQSAQNTQDAQAAKDADDAQNTKDGADSATPVDAKNDGKDIDKAKADKDAAAADSADKASSELLALVAAGQSAAQLTPQQSTPVTAPVTADMIKTGADAKKDGDAIDADGKSSKTVADLAQALPDAWNAKAGKGGKDAKTGPATTFKAGSPAADNKAAADAAASGKPDAVQLNAATTAAATTATALTGAKTPNPQVLTGTAPASNDNAMFNPALQQVVNASAQTPAAADKLNPTVGSPDWDSALGQKMVWMTGNGQQSATLTLNPRDLGPMQVVINVNKTQADATFIASNPEVKAALEAAMPKLREMMDQAGIQLGQANVSTGMPNQQQQAFNQPQHSGNGNRNGSANRQGGGADGDSGISAGAIAPAAAKNSSGGLGIVDTFV